MTGTNSPAAATDFFRDTPTVPAISERLEVASPREIAPSEEGKSGTEGILDG